MGGGLSPRGISEGIDLVFEPPPGFGFHERRLAGRALERWLEGGCSEIPGFEARCIIIADGAGAAMVERVGAPVSDAFGLFAGRSLDGEAGLAAEISAACNMINAEPLPAPIEAEIVLAGGALTLVRGIALPLAGPDGSAGCGRVQVIVSWRQIMAPAAAARLRHELGAALRHQRPMAASRRDPFARD